jgi:hypothetical protein
MNSHTIMLKLIDQNNKVARLSHCDKHKKPKDYLWKTYLSQDVLRIAFLL